MNFSEEILNYFIPFQTTPKKINTFTKHFQVLPKISKNHPTNPLGSHPFHIKTKKTRTRKPTTPQTPSITLLQEILPNSFHILTGRRIEFSAESSHIYEERGSFQHLLGWTDSPRFIGKGPPRSVCHLPLMLLLKEYLLIAFSRQI